MPTHSPVPLLAEPPPPLLLSQEARAQGAADLAETAQWRYRLRYLHEHRAQDEVIVMASFNVPPSEDAVATAPGDAPSRADYRLSARLDFSEDGENIVALRLSCEQGEPGPAGCWPYADYASSDGLLVDLGTGAGEGGVRCYVFEPALPYEGWPAIGLSWDGLNVAAAQNARAALAVVRNRGLVDEAAAVESVYRTPSVAATAAVAPHNRWPHAIDIGTLADSVDTALNAAFATLFGERWVGQPVTLGLSYGYSPLPGAEPDTAPMLYLPVGLHPKLPLEPATATLLAGLLASWKDAAQPPETAGEWAFSLALFSQVDTQAVQPLLDLGRLVYRLR